MSPAGDRLAIGYLLTFGCYGQFLPGMPGTIGSNTAYGADRASAEPKLEAWVRKQMREEPFVLGAAERNIVRDGVLEVFRHKEWSLAAVHVRSNHLHLLAGVGDISPASVASTVKRITGRRLREWWSKQEQEKVSKEIWQVGFGVRYLHRREHWEAALRYVVDGQGEKMAWWMAEMR